MDRHRFEHFQWCARCRHFASGERVRDNPNCLFFKRGTDPTGGQDCNEFDAEYTVWDAEMIPTKFSGHINFLGGPCQ